MVTVLLKTLKGLLLCRGWQKARSQHMLWVSLTEPMQSCIINNEVVLAVAGRGRNWLIQGTVALQCQS